MWQTRWPPLAARLEQAADKAAEVRAIVADTWRDHGRIVFNGNNYSAEWRAEAARRGLPDIPDMVRAAASYITEKNVAMFERTGVLTQAECHSRYEITLEGYAKHMHIDAATMLEMVSRSILPASYRYLAEVAKAERLTEQCSCACASAKAAVEKLCVSIDVAAGAAEALRRTLDAIDCAELNEGERAGAAVRWRTAKWPPCAALWMRWKCSFRRISGPCRITAPFCTTFEFFARFWAAPN